MATQILTGDLGHAVTATLNSAKKGLDRSDFEVAKRTLSILLWNISNVLPAGDTKELVTAFRIETEADNFPA